MVGKELKKFQLRLSELNCDIGQNNAFEVLIEYKDMADNEILTTTELVYLQDDAVLIDLNRERFVKKVLVRVLANEQSSNVVFDFNFEMLPHELIGRFGRVRARVPSRDLCGFIAYQYVRFCHLNIYQMSSYSTNAVYAFIASSNEQALEHLIPKMVQAINDCEALISAGQTHDSLYKDSRQMLMSMCTSLWHYYIAKGSHANSVYYMDKIISTLSCEALRKTTLGLNYIFTLYFRALLSQSDEELQEWMKKCLIFLDQFAGNFKPTDAVTPEIFMDASRIFSVGYFSRLWLEKKLTRNQLLKSLYSFNRVGQGKDKAQEDFFINAFFEMVKMKSDEFGFYHISK